jgi:hypothetical protein
MQNQFKEFYAELRRDFPNNYSLLTLFPSGSAMLDVKIGAETYVIEFSIQHVEVGVNRMSTATFGWEGYENVFNNFEEAKAFVLSLLKSN